MSGKIQNEDIKSSAELVSAGGSASQLPNDNKIYVASLSETLATAITNGDLTRAVRTINAQSGTSYTFVLSDGSKNGNLPLVTANNASAQTYTVPTNASVAFPVGTQIDVIQIGVGNVTFAPAGGVTLISKNSNLTMNTKGVGATLIKTATNTWVVLGDLIP